MASFIIASNHFLFFSHSTENHQSQFPSSSLMIHPRRKQSLPFGLVVPKDTVSFGFEKLNFGSSVLLFDRSSCSGLSQRGKGWEGEGDSALEAEILEFMQNSKKPNVFPSKKDLIEGGRMDLVDRIMKQGGWLSSGWDLDVEETVKEDGVQALELNLGFLKEPDNGFLSTDSRIHQGRFDGGINGSLGNVDNESFGGSSSVPSSSGRWKDSEEEAGIEGILRRLEKERNQSFGVSLREKRSSDDQDELHPEVCENERSQPSMSESSSVEFLDDSGAMSFQSVSLKPNTWRAFSYQRAASKRKFEDDEMVAKAASEIRNGTDLNSCDQEKVNDKEIDKNQISSRLHLLGKELSSVLCGLRSQKKLLLEKGKDNTSEELNILSDAWEFQETEIMKAQDKLRSLRAQLAILEGRMALAIIDTRKNVELKHKRINDANKALSLLRTACIIWPNTASEVFLVGSFDGWTSQRKMEKSRSGIFSLYLKLYPGRYEIKFIVDGSWMIDPLRPVVNNCGHQNNLLMVS